MDNDNNKKKRLVFEYAEIILRKTRGDSHARDESRALEILKELGLTHDEVVKLAKENLLGD